MNKSLLPGLCGLLATSALLLSCSNSDDVAPTTALQAVQQWVHGEYNNLAQAEADQQAGLPPNLAHRPMFQLFERVEIPGIPGYLLFQQSSIDGSTTPELIFRHGLMQYFADPDTGLLRQRELYFKENPDDFKNAHLHPEILEGITLDDMTWDPGCDFHLALNTDGTMVGGPIPGPTCILPNRGTGQNMIADDWVEITADEYRFMGRYRDEAGNVVWGTESDELNSLVRSD